MQNEKGKTHNCFHNTRLIPLFLSKSVKVLKFKLTFIRDIAAGRSVRYMSLDLFRVCVFMIQIDICLIQMYLPSYIYALEYSYFQSTLQKQHFFLVLHISYASHTMTINILEMSPTYRIRMTN